MIEREIKAAQREVAGLRDMVAALKKRFFLILAVALVINLPLVFAVEHFHWFPFLLQSASGLWVCLALKAWTDASNAYWTLQSRMDDILMSQQLKKLL